MSKKKLILIQLNEINFHIFKEKLKGLTNFTKVTNLNKLKTFSEESYDLLEPWIQWVSVYTGKDAKNHKIFRLGDYSFDNKQIFKLLEEQNYKVGAICPMNAYNDLEDPKYFFPDPWSDTPSDGIKFYSKLYNTLSHLVNNNSQNKITFKSFFIFLFYLIYFMQFKNLTSYVKLLFGIIFLKKSWNKSLIFDLFLNDFHVYNLKKFNPDFSSIFFNAGAHIQHHYFLNMVGKSNLNPKWYIDSKKDPSQDLFKIYDKILENHLALADKYDLLVLTGLSQDPCLKPSIYYRLKDHKKFFSKFNITFKEILPRMTRDFTMIFENNEQAKSAEEKISKFLTSDGEKLFGTIDNRGNSLFITLTYANEVKKDDKFFYNDKLIDIYDDFVFVAIKNGIHDQNGYLFTSMNVDQNADKIHIKESFNLIKNYFKI